MGKRSSNQPTPEERTEKEKKKRGPGSARRILRKVPMHSVRPRTKQPRAVSLLPRPLFKKRKNCRHIQPNPGHEGTANAATIPTVEKTTVEKMAHLFRLMYSDEVTNTKCKFNDEQLIAAIVTELLTKRINQLCAKEKETLSIAAMIKSIQIH